MPNSKHAENVFERCDVCLSIAEYSQLVGTNPQDIERILYCAEHAEMHMDQGELEEHRLEVFDSMVMVTFEWVSGGVETRIPLGFVEAQEKYKKELEEYFRTNPLNIYKEED